MPPYRTITSNEEPSRSSFMTGFNVSTSSQSGTGTLQT
ncbi:hypothetical protein C789_4318 [Microcystis aeruginosa FACHB-905 = DIANCHI905]|nr:hypothetical protein C789_4318 [Microcystis aeruginosa FACHB-905 = DIANCHI905]